VQNHRFEEPQIETLQECGRKYGFDVQYRKHELYGTCSECQKKRDEARANKARR
jgi:Fur family ferric uptake transcriptional regulator